MSDYELCGLGATEANDEGGGGEDYDLHGVTAELVRRGDGSWEFWAVLLPNGQRIGAQQKVAPEAAAWLEGER